MNEINEDDRKIIESIVNNEHGKTKGKEIIIYENNTQLPIKSETKNEEKKTGIKEIEEKRQSIIKEGARLKQEREQRRKEREELRLKREKERKERELEIASRLAGKERRSSNESLSESPKNLLNTSIILYSKSYTYVYNNIY